LADKAAHLDCSRADQRTSTLLHIRPDFLVPDGVSATETWFLDNLSSIDL
jgi:hypothetical protein